MLAFAIGCTKKETVTETPETTTNTTVVKENSSDKAVEKNENVAEKPEKSENENNDDLSNDETTKIQEYTYEGRLLKLTFRHDGEGNEVVVIDEAGKRYPWLYRDRQTNVYEMDGVKLTVNGNKVELDEQGKKTVFNLK